MIKEIQFIPPEETLNQRIESKGSSILSEPEDTSWLLVLTQFWYP